MSATTRAARKGGETAGVPATPDRCFIGENADRIVSDARVAYAALRSAEAAIVHETTAIGAAFIAACRSGMVAKVGDSAPTRITLRSFAELVLGDAGSRMTIQRGRALASMREARPDLSDPTVGEAGRIPASFFGSDHRLTPEATAVLASTPANGSFADAVEALRVAAGKGKNQRPGGTNAGPDSDDDQSGEKSGPPSDASATAVADSVCALIRAFESRIGRKGWSFSESYDALSRIFDAVTSAQAVLDAAVEEAD